MKNRKVLGFTLIELLIVIAIIGILAVAFLPNLLDAPGKSRDAKRIADLGAVRDAIYMWHLDTNEWPEQDDTSKCLSDAVTNADLLASMGGAAPVDPSDEAVTNGCDSGYTYIQDPNGADTPSGTYTFVLLSALENYSEQNSFDCDDAMAGVLTPTGDETVPGCYAILTQ